MKAVLVNDILAAEAAGQRGSFEYWARGGREGDGAPDGLHFVCPGCGELGSLAFQGRRDGLPGGWTWDGNREAPTCTPSILHSRSTCGWHGYLTAGEFVPC